LEIFEALKQATPDGSQFISLAPDNNSVEDRCCHKDHHIRFTAKAQRRNNAHRSSTVSSQSLVLKNVSNALLTHPLLKGLMDQYDFDMQEEDDGSVEDDSSVEEVKVEEEVHGESIPLVSQVSLKNVLFVCDYYQQTQNALIFFVLLYLNIDLATVSRTPRRCIVLSQPQCWRSTCDVHVPIHPRLALSQEVLPG
jgi:hypothetical protein